jgi:hypothetical protein
MAQKVSTVLIDDLDGSEADTTVAFGLDGAHYEIDLTAGHASELRDILAPYVAAARRSPGNPSRRPNRGGRRASASESNPAEIRDWAKTHGIEVSERGRVPADLRVKFRQATGK